MVQGLHYSHFAEEFLEAARVELGLIDDLDGHLLARGYVLGQFNL